jgi:phosphoglycolate phosphatase-like HAD superfamily hydrolase
MTPDSRPIAAAIFDFDGTLADSFPWFLTIVNSVAKTGRCVIVQEAPHLRPHVARNPATYPALLDWLGALGDPEVDAALRSRR